MNRSSIKKFFSSVSIIFPSQKFEAATFLVHYSDDRPDLRDVDVEKTVIKRHRLWITVTLKVCCATMLYGTESTSIQCCVFTGFGRM